MSTVARYYEIDRENRILLSKMSDIMRNANIPDRVFTGTACKVIHGPLRHSEPCSYRIFIDSLSRNYINGFISRAVTRT